MNTNTIVNQLNQVHLNNPIRFLPNENILRTAIVKSLECGIDRANQITVTDNRTNNTSLNWT